MTTRLPNRCAIVCARGLGDALIFMTLAHNLALSGAQVTLFSSILCELREWFPNCTIQPFPKEHELHTTFAPYDMVIAADHSLVKESHAFGNQLLVLKENRFDKAATLVENLVLFCKQTLLLPFFLKDSGIAVPAYAEHRKYPKRVCLHPMSTDVKKNWSAEKFISLSYRLEKQGYETYFCVSRHEALEWKKLIAEDKLRSFATISDLALFIYESGYLIGNDSGLGHLASALSVPTLSLFARKSYSRLWRPGFGPGLVVTPPSLLPGSRLKQKYWKKLLSVGRVIRAFSNL